MRFSLLMASAAFLPGLATAQERTVDVAMHYTEEQAAPLLACFDRYEAANPGVSIAYQQISYGEYLQTVLTARIGGTAPDIYNVYGSLWGAQMVDNGVLAEAPPRIVEMLESDFLSDPVGSATIDGTVWGVPTEVSAYMLVSNMTLLEAAGYDAPPATWNEALEIAEAVTTRTDQGRIGNAGFAFAVSSSGAGVVHPFYALMASQGATIYADDFSSANLDSPEAIAAAEQMAQMVARGITERSIDAYDFPAGGIGMMVMANWYESAIRDGLGDGFDTVTVSSIPAGDTWQTMQYAFFMGVDSGSDVTDEAWNIVAYVNSPESAAVAGGPSCMGEMMDGLGALSANVADRAALGDMDDFTRPYWNALEDGRAISQPNVLQASEIERAIAATLDTIIAGEAEAGPAMAALDAEVEDILAEFY